MSLSYGPQDSDQQFPAFKAPENAKPKSHGTYFPFFFSLFYASVLAALPVEEFIDRASYLSYAVDSYLVYLRYLNKSLISVPFNEPLWLVINMILYYFLDMRNVVRAIIFISSFSVSFTLLRRFKENYIWIIFILIFPQFIKNYIIHLRQGAAISLFIAGYYARYPLRRFIITGLSPFVHSSFFFVYLMLYFNNFVGLLKINIYIRIFIFLAFYTALIYSIQFAASQVGARQAGDLEKDVINASGLAFVFWIGILLVFLSEGPKFLKDNIFQTSVIVFYLIAYIFTSYAGRIFESAMVLVMIAMIELTGWRKPTAMTMMVVLGAYLYASNIGNPWLGWGL